MGLVGRCTAAALAATVAILGLSALAGGTKKKPRKQPRGPYPALGKCPVFPESVAPAGAPSAADQTAWNQDVSGAPIHPSSEDIIARINATGGDDLHPDFGSPREYGFPYSVVGRKQKRVRVKFTAYGDESDRGRYRVPPKALVEGGQKSDGDRHVLSFDRGRCLLYELYRAFFRKGKRRWEADSGVIWNLRSAKLRPDGWTSADAAGLPVFPGLVGYDEARKGTIDHAIRVTFSSTRDAWIHPASHCAGDTNDADAPPMGMRLRLRPGYDLSGLSGEARAIAVALKRYGMIVADNGSNWFFSGTSDRRWNDENLNQLKDIPGSAFQVVRSAAPVHVC
jgi:hypothetical protein